MRSAWNVRVAGWMDTSRDTMARWTVAARSVVVANGRPTHDGPGDPPRPAALLPKPGDHAGKLPLRDPRQPVAERLALAGVHPHVERPRTAKREPPGRVFELRGRNPEVEQHSVDPAREAAFAADLAQCVEARVYNRQTRIAECGARAHRLGVPGRSRPPGRVAPA